MQQCRADGLIDPDAIPGTNIQPAVVDEASTAFTKSGTAVADGGTDVKAKWGGLAGSYETPDSAQLLSVMDSVVTDTASLSTTMASVAKAVSTYASAIEPVVAELKKIQGEARTFVAKALKGKTVGPWDPDHPANRGLVELVQNFGQVLDDVHIPWDQYQPYIKENNDLLTRVAEQETKLSAASADCVNAINGLRTDMCIAPVSGVDYAGAVKANQPMVWGATGRGDQSCGQKFGSGIEDAAKGTVEGLGGLVSYNAQTGKWGDWDWAGKSWLGFAESLGAIVLIGSPPLLLAAYLPKGMVPDEVRNTALNIVDKQKQIVEGFVGTPEDWANDPAHAAGGLTFNVGTLFIPGAGEVGAGAKVASIAAKVGTIGADGSKLAAVTAKVAAVGTTVVRVGDALSAMRAGVRGAVDDAMSAVRSDLAKSLHSLADRIPGINVAVERAAMPGGMDIGLGHPRIEVEPGGGGQWLHSVADHVGGAGSEPNPAVGAHHDAASHADVATHDGSTSDGAGVHGAAADGGHAAPSEGELRAPGEASTPVASDTAPAALSVDDVSVHQDGPAISDPEVSKAFHEFGGVEAMERRWGQASHTTSRHLWGDEPGVLQTDAQVMGRDPMPLEGHGAFRLAEGDLNKVIGQALEAAGGDVKSWVSGGSSKLFVRNFEATAPVGVHFGGALQPTASFRIILRRDIQSPLGFYLKSAFPIRAK